jgi:hypothetical protein
MDGELLKNTNGLRYITDNYTLETGLPRQIIQTSKNFIISKNMQNKLRLSLRWLAGEAPQ